MIVVKVRDRDIKAAPMGPVTSGSVGLPVSWHFIGKEWEDLAKAAVFRVGEDGEGITVAVLEDLCLVPDELLVQANAGENLWIGVYGWKGTNANDTIVPEIAMPTIWTYTRIQDGSQPSGIEPPEGTPGWSAQIQNATDEALRVAHGVAVDAAAGEFDGSSPAVTISSITHGHSVTITDRDHPTGQTFNVLDGDSAYEQAVAGGYTKSEAQFNAELGSFGELSEQAADSAAAAAQSESNAAGSATTATTKAQEAEAAAAQALIRMNSAATSAQAAEDASSFFTSTILPNAVTTINNTRDQAVANVNVAKHTAVQDVSDEGATQISALQTESTTQQAAIQQKGEDVLESIPADYTELTEDVDDLKSAFNADLVSTSWTPNIERGSFYRIADGSVGTSAKYARTSALWNGYGILKAIVVDDPTYEFCLALYDETGTTSGAGYLGYTAYTTGTLYIPQNAKLFGVSFRRTDNASLANSDITAISAALLAFAATDTTLSVAGASADAKATGDRLAENRNLINAHSAQQLVSIENAVLQNWWINQSGVVASAERGRFLYIPCLANTLYKIDHPKSYRFIVGCFDTTPTVGSIPTKAVTGASANMREETSFILTETGTKYLGLYYYNLNYTGGYTMEEAYAALAVYTGGVDATLKHEGVAADAKAVGAIAKNRNYFAVADDTVLVPTFEGVIGLYDALASLYPDYVTKNTLTAGTFTNYEYVLTVGNYNTAGNRTRDTVIARPKVLVSAGMHGYERSAVMSLYKFVKSLCENAYDLDDVIYFCEMHVLPVICPWGYNNDERLNENGVDLNHNFDNTTWPGDSTSGSAPADQPETQIVQNWINANTDAKIYIDWHNSGYTNEISVLLGADTESNRKIKLDYLHGIDKVIPYWQKAREITATYIYGYTGTTGPGGTAKGYGAEKGLNSFTFETSWNIKSTGKHSAFSIGTGAEAIGNLIKGIRELFL